MNKVNANLSVSKMKDILMVNVKNVMAVKNVREPHVLHVKKSIFCKKSINTAHKVVH